ncbi:MAG: SPFH domain-containing protein [Candidatus Thorarchaeota archaeon]|jgi:regulator of protease activity HflC (stomatin/prohibitin superfamily)
MSLSEFFTDLLINPGVTLVIGFFLIIILLRSTVFVVKEWERYAVLRFGNIHRVVDGGLHFRIPIIENTIAVDIRTQELDLSRQTTITKDNISVGIDAVLFVSIDNATLLITKVRDYVTAITRASQAALRNIVGNYELDDLLSHRDEIAQKLDDQIHSLAEGWGIKVVRIGLQDISLPEDMKRAFAVQAEAERESRAIQIKANAELQASDKLTRAAKKMKEEVGSMQLRILQTVNDISKDQSNTIIFALPFETLRGLNTGELGAMASIGSSHAKLKAVVKEILAEVS